MDQAADELVDVIDEAGRTVAVVARREMRTRRLPHRSTAVLVFNTRCELFIHLRTPTKDVFPSRWDVAIGGVLAAGETFAEGVRREVREELGVDARLEELFPFRYADEHTIAQVMVYKAVHDGPFHLQAEEIVRGEFVAPGQVKERATREPFCPDGLAVLAEYARRQGAAMKLLLGSGGFRTDERIRLLAQHMHAHFGPVERVLFIPFALADHDKYVQSLTERGLHAGYILDGIHHHADPKKAVREAQAIYVGGGNTFRLLDALQRFDLLDEIRARVGAGVPYLGISAGANVACPTIMTTNDMPIVQPPSFRALGLVPFQINAHYFTGQSFVKEGDNYLEHFGETRDERIGEFHELNDTPVLGLWEGGLLRIRDQAIYLEGAGARLFRRGMESVDFPAGSELATASVGA